MNTVKLKLFIFDLDGTLVNAYPAITESFNYTMEKTGYPLQSADIIRKAVGWGDKSLLKPFIRRKDLKRALAIYRKHHARSLLRGTRPYPGVSRVLKRLKSKKMFLAIASNRPTKFTLIILRHLKLKRYFNKILCADKLKARKPNPRILKEIMKSFLVSRKETIYVGDMTIDAKTGSAAGVCTVIVTTGSSTREDILRESPFSIIDRIDQLLDIIK